MAPLFSLSLAALSLWLMVTRIRIVEPVLFFVIASGCGLALALEALSLGNAISLTSVRTTFAGVLVASGALAYLLRDHLGSEVPPQRAASGLARIAESLAHVVVFALLAITAFTAMASLPNTWDSMTYHLPRIEHWLQNRSFAFYPTAIPRQLDSNILAEEWILAFRSLRDSYQGANLVQWLAYAGCILLSGRIVRDLGGARSAEAMGMLLTATLPMAILQASSTQTDLVMAFFAMASIHYLLRVRPDGAVCLVYGAVLAAALAMHAKGTALMLLSGFVIVYGSRILIRARSFRFFGHALAALVLAGLLLSGHLLRNVAAYSTPVGAATRATSITEPTFNATLFNLVRGTASNIDVADAGARESVVAFVRASGAFLGIGETDDRYSFEGNDFVLPAASRHEDTAANTAYLALIVLAAICLPFTALARPSSRERLQPLAAYAAAGALSIVAFASLIKWQPWITRLQLGEFIMTVPVVAIAIAGLGPAAPLLMLLLAVQAAPFAFSNQSRPILGPDSIVTRTPEAQLFANRPDLLAPYQRLADAVAALRPKRVVLAFGRDSWEFPLWYLLRQRLTAAEMPLIVHRPDRPVNSPDPSMIVSVEGDPDQSDMTELPGFDPFRLIVPEAVKRAP